MSAKRRGPDTVISNLRQEGSLKALFPKVRGRALQAVFLNTAGGLTGGDHMRIAATAQKDAHIVLSSQAAERAYRAQPNQVARAEVTFWLEAGARIDWLPQETILFDHAALDRRLSVHLDANATALIVEPIIFGRVAMGERVRKLHLTDQWRIWRNERLIFADAIRLIGDAEELMKQTAIGAGAGALATVLFAGAQATAFVGSFDLPALSGASLIDEDLLLIRLLAQDGFDLRRQLIPIVEALSSAPIPRVWRL